MLMEHEEVENNTAVLWLKHFKGLSDKQNGQMFLIILIVASLLLVSDVFFNDYPTYLALIRLLVTILGFISFLLFKLKRISGEIMVLLYVVPAVCVGGYMPVSLPELPGISQATSVVIIFGFVLETLTILTPRKWLVISLTLIVSYLTSIILFGDYPVQVYLNNSGTLLILCFIGFPYVEVIRYRLYRKNFLLQNEIEYYANNDLLTGSYNRRSGIRMLEQFMRMYERNNLKLSICFIDVNGLKKVNDNYGHGAGDELLKTTTEVIRESIRKSDTLFRYGGDEFVIIFPDCGESESNKIMEKIRAESKKRKTEYQLSFSYGIAEYKKDLSLNELIKLADDRMYQDKKKMTQ